MAGTAVVRGTCLPARCGPRRTPSVTLAWRCHSSRWRRGCEVMLTPPERPPECEENERQDHDGGRGVPVHPLGAGLRHAVVEQFVAAVGPFAQLERIEQLPGGSPGLVSQPIAVDGDELVKLLVLGLRVHPRVL